MTQVINSYIKKQTEYILTIKMSFLDVWIVELIAFTVNIFSVCFWDLLICKISTRDMNFSEKFRFVASNKLVSFPNVHQAKVFSLHI